MVQLSHPYMTTGKTIALTVQSFVGKVMSLLWVFHSFSSKEQASFNFVAVVIIALTYFRLRPPYPALGFWLPIGLYTIGKSQQYFRFYVSLFSFWPRHTACRILVPQPGIKPIPPVVEAQCVNHWSTRKSPSFTFLKWNSVPLPHRRLASPSRFSFLGVVSFSFQSLSDVASMQSLLVPVRYLPVSPPFYLRCIVMVSLCPFSPSCWTSWVLEPHAVCLCISAVMHRAWHVVPFIQCVAE